MTEKEELKHLLSLLDDESDSVAVPVLAALLEHHTDLYPYLAKLQEHKNPAVRRRVHQLQSILIIRERRYNMLEKIENSELSFPEYLLELHLQLQRKDLRPHLRILCWLHRMQTMLHSTA